MRRFVLFLQNDCGSFMRRRQREHRARGGTGRLGRWARGTSARWRGSGPATEDGGNGGEIQPGGAASDAPVTDAACVPSTTTPPPDQPGCGGAMFSARPSDPGAPGPWAVGAHTSTIAGLTTEIWYPAKWGSDACQPQVTYDIRLDLPASQQGKIPRRGQPAPVLRLLPRPADRRHARPLPRDHVHPRHSGVRTQSLTFMTHWASRGFIVVSSDHPEIDLADILGNPLSVLTANEEGDAVNVLKALATPTGNLSFLAGHGPHAHWRRYTAPAARRSTRSRASRAGSRW